MLVCSKRLKPGASTASEYLPTGNRVNEYVPFVSVLVVNVSCVPRFVTVTLAPATAACVLSLTIPRIPAVVVCAAIGATMRTTNETALIILPVARLRISQIAIGRLLRQITVGRIL